MDINETQPRAIRVANSTIVKPGDIYICTQKRKYPVMGVVTEVEDNHLDGLFSCIYNYMHQDKETLKREVRKRKSCNLSFGTEEGFFLRRAEDSRLEIIAATKDFISELEIVEEMFNEKIKPIYEEPYNPK